MNRKKTQRLYRKKALSLRNPAPTPMAIGARVGPRRSRRIDEARPGMEERTISPEQGSLCARRLFGH